MNNMTKPHEQKSKYFRNRYFSALNQTRDVTLNKEQQIEVCYVIKTVKDYGFDFFPEIYIKPEIIKLEQMTKNNNRGDRK